MNAFEPGIAGRLDALTKWIATIAFLGLVLIAILTFYDGIARTLGFARISGFSDYTHLLYPIVIASCFPAGLLHEKNIVIRFGSSLLGSRPANWLEVLGALASLIFFTVIVWQFFELTADFAINERTSRTVELPLAPSWLITSIILSMTIPVQAWVFWRHLRRASGKHDAAADPHREDF